MLLIYLQHDSPRTRYIMDFFFSGLFTVSYRITGNLSEYALYTGPKLSYSAVDTGTGVQFIACGLLAESTVMPTKILLETQNGKHIAYFPRLQQPPVTFDPFASAFFLVTRYEEWLPYQADEHGRFRAEDSAQVQAGLAEFPLVNYWADQVISLLLQHYPEFRFSKPEFRATITLDIDHTYAFLHKGFWRSAAILLRHIFRQEKKSPTPWQVWRKKATDPYDTYDYLEQQHRASGLDFVYFLLMGSYSRMDKNIAPSSPAFKTLANKLATEASLGIHPSYYCREYPEKLRQEIQRLETISGKKIIRSRQHFLRFTIPETYRRLGELGIQEEYSMGFSGQPGFRAGTCTPFVWFDLERNLTTGLKIFPITWMEGTYAEHLKLDADQAWQRMRTLIETVKEWHGHFIPLWHNHSVADYGAWKGWSINFERMLELLKEDIP